MKLQNLSVTTREGAGKGIARQTRRDGSVPVVLYGDNKESVSLVVNARALDLLFRGKQGEHAIVQLEVSDKPEFTGPAIVKEVQHHPVRGQVMHADFMRIRLDEKIRTQVPLKVTGRSVGVIEGGILDYQMREIEIECIATDVPEFFEIDVTALAIGDSLRVSVLVAPEGVEIMADADRALVAVQAPRVQVEEEVAEVEGEEGAEEGAEEAKEGETPAEGEEKSDD